MKFVETGTKYRHYKPILVFSSEIEDGDKEAFLKLSKKIF